MIFKLESQFKRNCFDSVLILKYSTWVFVLCANCVLHLLIQEEAGRWVCHAPHHSLHSSGLSTMSHKQPHYWRWIFILSGWPLVIITTHIIPSASSPWLVLLGPIFTASFVSSRGPRLSNRDCACLRLSQGFKVGSYPSLAIQPSILAWCRGPNGQRCCKQRGHDWL